MARNMVKRLLVGKSEGSTIYLREKALFGREPRGAFLRRVRIIAMCDWFDRASRCIQIGSGIG